ncbi:hypothetical protein RJ640_022473 [Escallonia rubra]|uniref:Integrase catalytic domain-containing protein n=1 Tax=Escallonia rubra TaxID=112253 RepID=A0AA88RGG2_9ASTE|nr:hypothetical protein RJ640_022473 [Escallonia rubra]
MWIFSTNVHDYCYCLVYSPAAITGYLFSIESLSGTNFRKWKEQISIILGVMDLDYALRVDAPAALTAESSTEQKAAYEKWERSNRISLMIMKGSITTAIRGAIPDSDNAKLYLAHIEEQFQGSSKAHATTLITKMVMLKYSGSKGVREHILRMNGMASQLKCLDMEISEGKGKKFGKGNVQGNKSASVTKTDKASSSGTKGSSGPRCHFCKDKGHMRKECHKFREWLEKKGNLSICVCYESYTIDAPLNTWWVDTGATVHITNSLQGFLSVKKLNKGDRNVLVGNGEKAQVEAVGTLCLVLESGYNLNLVDTVYVPSMTRNLISVSRLDAYGYSFKFEDKGFSLFLYSRVIGSGLLEGNLYKLLLNASFTESLKTMNVNDVVAKTCGTPQQNGVAERRNRTLMDMVRSMICQSTLPEFLWVEALKTAVHILNRVPKVLKRFNMHNCAPTVAPVVKGDKFSFLQCPRNQLEQDEMECIPYASAVGSLMYAQICTRPDIAYVVGMLGRYQINPGMGHWKAAKKVMRYLQGTKNFMLTYRKSDNLKVKMNDINSNKKRLLEVEETDLDDHFTSF